MCMSNVGMIRLACKLYSHLNVCSIIRMPELRSDLRQSISSAVTSLLAKLMELYKVPANAPVANTPALSLIRSLTRSQAFSQDCAAPVKSTDAAMLLAQILTSMPPPSRGERRG